MKFYEIEAELVECFDPETGEIIDEEKFQALGMEWDRKVEGIALSIKELTAEAAAIKEEKQNLEARQKQKERKAENLKAFLGDIMAGQKLETPRVAISWRKSEKLVINENAAVPEQFLKYKAPEVDKVELKKAVKAGQTFEGVTLEENQNLQIK